MGDARISTGQNKFGGTSGLFDGIGDYITTPSSALFGFGAGDFTVDAWVYLPTLSGMGVAYALFDNRTTSISGIGLSQQGMRFVVSKPANNILTYDAGWTGTGTAANPLSPTNVTYNGGYLGGGTYPVFNSASFTAAIGGTLRITHPGFLIDCDCDGGKGIAINGTVVQGWGMSCSAHPPPHLIFTTLTRTVTAGQTIQFTGIDCYWSAYDKQFRVWIEPN